MLSSSQACHLIVKETGLKIPAGGRQTSWPQFTSMTGDRQSRAGLKPATSGFQVRRTNLSATLCRQRSEFFGSFHAQQNSFLGKNVGICFFIIHATVFSFGSFREFLSPLICCMNFFWLKSMLER